jgi:hypothetical protein
MLQAMPACMLKHELGEDYATYSIYPVKITSAIISLRGKETALTQLPNKSSTASGRRPKIVLL